MSVIWSGITEGGAIVPVQVDDSGKVVATADPRPELWTKTGEILTPTTVTDNIQTSGNIILNGSAGSGTLTAADSAGVKVYALPAESGTLALESDDPPPSGGGAPFAAGAFYGSELQQSVGIRQWAQFYNQSKINLFFEKDLIAQYPAVSVNLWDSGSGFITGWRTVSSGLGAIIINFFQEDGSAGTFIPTFSFAMWDMGAVAPLTTVPRGNDITEEESEALYGAA